MSEERIIREATFNSNVCTYWLLSGAIVFCLTIVGIPLLLFWFPIGFLVCQRYLASMECVLTTRNLKVKKGIFIVREQTVPLDKITDMSLVEGPIMRIFNLQKLSIETAGQSGPGALLSLTGINDGRGFREAVLKQRDQVTESKGQAEIVTGTSDDSGVLCEIKDSLLRIEKLLEQNSN
jgi:putative membrane protein